MQLNKNLKNCRLNCKMTQQSLAEQLGISRQAVSKWEHNVATPDISNLVKISELCDVSLDALLKAEIARKRNQ